MTPQRTQVLRLVIGAGKPLKAYDVLAEMVKENGDTSPITAYRALDFLTDHGFIHRLASLGAYVACECPQHSHAVPFLICDTCHAVVVEMVDDRIVALVETLAESRGFSPRAQTLEVRGVCAACQEAAAKSSLERGSRITERSISRGTR